MAEALATGVTVLTLIDYIDKGVQFARKVAHAREAVSVLVTRLELLRLKLKGLAAFISERGVVDAVFDRTSVLSNILHTYNTKLQVLTTKLEDISNSRTRQLLWPFNEKEYKDSLDDLAKLSDFVDSTLQLDSTALLSKSASQVKELLAKQSHVVKALEALEAQSQSIQHTVQSTQQSLAESQIAKGRQELLHWLSSHDHAARHHECLSRKVESTGLWILNEPDFLKWRDDPQSPSVLCCYGHAGSGKSVLASTIIEHLETTRISSRVPLAFFYCDYRSESAQLPQVVASSLLRQLVARAPVLPQQVLDEQLRSSTSTGHAEALTIDLLSDLVGSVLSCCDGAYLVLDAIDECLDASQRNRLMQVLQQLVLIPGTKVLITGRDHVLEDRDHVLEDRDLPGLWAEAPSIRVAAREEDLRLLVQSRLRQRAKRLRLSAALEAKIISAVIDTAHGSFLLPLLCLEGVLREPTLGDMKDALDALPRTLDQAFDSTFRRIGRQSESTRGLALNSIMWTAFSLRLLHTTELCEALCIARCNEKELMDRDDEYTPADWDILEACQGLLIRSDRGAHLDLVHFSLLEYIQQSTPALFRSPHAGIAVVCITNLTYRDIKCGPSPASKGIERRLSKYPLLEYATEFWGHHARITTQSEAALSRAMDRLLSSPQNVSSVQQLERFSQGYVEDYWTYEVAMSHRAIHTLAHFGLNDRLRKELDASPADVDVATTIGSTPLVLAAATNRTETVKILLDAGADKQHENRYGNCLHCAAEAGCVDTCRMLIDVGMDFD